MAPAPLRSADVAYSFGRFRLIPAQQLLLDGDRPLRIGSRALAILITLVERAGEVVPKKDIFRKVWPGTTVEEGNLRVHVTALRRALGDSQRGMRFIAGIPGLGYRFVAPTQIFTGPKPVSTHPSPHKIPLPLSRLIGRDALVSTLSSQLSRWRLLTLAGAGGIGKTSVALAVVHNVVARFRDEGCFVDLAPLSDPALVPSALAAVLGVGVRTDDPVPGLIAHLHDKRMLLVLDSCEHVLEAVAALVESVLKAAPGVHILATSREPLQVADEAVVRLSPLGMPAANAAITACEALTYPAIQLFVERATALLDHFELTDTDAPVVAEICRKLDGMPLAIELAAGRLGTFGVRGLAERLRDQFRLLTHGRRTALPRHQTLRATLDWSHGLLSTQQQAVFRRLSVFAGWFSADAATSAASEDVKTVMADLVSKSLVWADVDGVVTRYRLLDTTRAYAGEKLAETGETGNVQRRHAMYFRALLEQSEAEWDTRPTEQWLAAYAPQLDNARAALDWAFSPAGDADIGVALTVATVPLWSQLSLLRESFKRVEQSLASLGVDARAASTSTMKLHAARGASLMYGSGPAQEMDDAWGLAHALAEQVGDTDYRLRALWGLWAGRMKNAEFTAAGDLANRFHALAPESADPVDCAIGERMFGAALHFQGDQQGARLLTERLLARPPTQMRRSYLVRYQFDPHAMARIMLARILWLQGYADQAMRTVDAGVEDAQGLGHTLSLCNTLVQSACPVALLAGDLERAARFTDSLLRRAEEQNALGIWSLFARGYQGQILIKQGDFATGVLLVRTALTKLREAGFVQHDSVFVMALAEGLIGAGRSGEAMVVIDEGLTRTQRSGELWCRPEMLRIQGEGRLALGDVAAAEECFAESLDLSRQQAALAWELRTAISLTRLSLDQGRDLLGSIVCRLTEGLDTADARAACLLLQS
jgi:predicted ATPase/DNA-binding winged helix-turn-helix (wHTH) protein